MLEREDLILVSAETAKQCGDICDQTSAFNCRSYTYFPSSGVCRLSGDDNISAFTGAVQERAGAEHYQRPACIDLSLVCTAQSMTVTLKTEEPFTGRLFAQDTGRDCQILGTARTETKLSFYFEPSAAAKYGVERGERGVYSSVVVVQHHQVIQRKGDRAVKLLCYFETGDKVVTNSYDVIAEFEKF